MEMTGLRDKGKNVFDFPATFALTALISFTCFSADAFACSCLALLYRFAA